MSSEQQGEDYQPAIAAQSARFWPQLKRLLIFQFKLYIDAIRDLLLSAASLVAFVLDVIQQNHGEDSHFSNVLRLGRRSERAINLFDQHTADEQGAASVDAMIRNVEERLRK